MPDSTRDFTPSDSSAALPSGTTKRKKATALGAGLLAVAAALAAHPVLAAPELGTIDFLPAVQSNTQNARVLLVNLAPAGRVTIPPGPCRVTVEFLNINGDPVGAGQSFTIDPGHTVIAVAPLVGAGVPTTLRAHVVTPPGPPVVPPGPCAALHGSYEVFDTQTLETKFVSPGAIRGFNPQPDPPAAVGR